MRTSSKIHSSTVSLIGLLAAGFSAAPPVLAEEAAPADATEAAAPTGEAAPAEAAAPAEETAPAEEAGPSDAPTRGQGGAYTHDGFYFNLGVGLGIYNASTDTPESSMGGLTKSFAFQVGGSLAKGLTLGGGFNLDHASSPTYKVGGQEVNIDALDLSQMLISIGPFVDYYLDPAGGLHFLGMVGWGGLETSQNGNAGGSDPTGMAITLGAGYDFFVASELSLGGLVRFTYAPLSQNDVSVTTTAPALLLTLTYH